MIELRRALPGDEDALLPMMDAFNAGEGIIVDPAHLRGALSRLLSDHNLGTVSFFERAGRTCGYAAVTYGYDLEFAGRDAFLTEIYVLPEARGAGLATTALAALERATAAAGVHALHLMVRSENSPAVRLYHAAGYSPAPRVFLSKLL